MSTKTPEEIKLLELQARELELNLATREEKELAEKVKTDLEIKKLQFQTRQEELRTMRSEKDLKLDQIDSYNNGIFNFFQTVDKSSVQTAINSMDEFSRHYPKQPIVLNVNSPGGSVLEGFALYDFLQELRQRGHHVTVRCFGMAASMGGIILQAGDRREMSKRAFVLIHQVSSMSWGKLGDMKDDLEFSELLWTKCAEILAERSNLSTEELKTKTDRKDWWIPAEQCLTMGLVDGICETPSFVR